MICQCHDLNTRNKIFELEVWAGRAGETEILQTINRHFLNLILGIVRIRTIPKKDLIRHCFIARRPDGRFAARQMKCASVRAAHWNSSSAYLRKRWRLEHELVRVAIQHSFIEYTNSRITAKYGPFLKIDDGINERLSV